ncbi:MAG: alpha/beta fold hydrolase, partial [Sphingomonas sp.]
FQVIRYDQRDTGFSSKLPEGDRFDAGDVADDAAGLLEALEIREAHVAGISAGGVFAQYLAIRHPRRVLSLISMMSTSGDVRSDPLIDPPADSLREFREQAPPADRGAKIERMVLSFMRYLSGPRYPVNEDFVRRYATSMVDRDGRTGDAPRLIQAVYASLPVPAERITAPTLVIHGTADPLLRYTAGLSTVRAITGARLLTVEGMGHDLISPRAFPWMVEAFAHHAETAPPRWVQDGLRAAPES